jgi:hypothetical protein
MRLSFVLVATVCVGLFFGAQAQARPFCDRFPDAPICNPGDPDPCEIDPASCEPDPCELDPASCEPDPCEVDPASCPEPDPCEVDPASCEPEPDEFSHVARLEGTMAAKGKGLKNRTRAEYSLDLGDVRFQMANKSFSLEGTLVPLNDKGTKFELVLDAALGDPFATFVIEEALPDGMALPEEGQTQTLKMILKLRRDGSAALRIRGSVLLKGTDAITFKARFAGPVEIPVKA